MKNTGTIQALTLLLGIFFSVASMLQAQNATLSIQGVLKKFDGAAVDDAEYGLTFTLWKTPSGTSTSDNVWSETITGVETRGGVYSVVLGANGTPLDAPFDQVYYLGVKIGSGQELSPRPVLTHAPYALSLLGLTNTFPSTGMVIADGISVSGEAFVGAAADAKMNIKATDATPEKPVLNVQSSGGDDLLSVRNDGRVNIGPYNAKASNAATLNITTQKIWAPAEDPEQFNANGATLTSGLATNAPNPIINAPNEMVSIYAAGPICSALFAAFSDARIKEVVGRSNNAEDLNTLRKIKITDYTHIDKITKGGRLHKKVIAQELEAVFPTAVSTITDVVPDLYQFATIQNGRVELKNNLKPGEMVQLIFGSERQTVEVLAADATGFSVPVQREGQVFVYGREVNDFRVVDYEALTTLNVSATQELVRRLELLETENAALKAENTALQTNQGAAAKTLEALAKRLETLEARANLSGAK